jgi:tetratricopeptide (TPR) repeat protein
MRDRHWRRLVDSDRDRQRTAAAAASGGVRGWLRKHIVIRIISIIGVPLVGVITVWFSGFFDSIFQNVVPSGADTFCVLHEAIENYWPFATQPAPPDRFTILIARIDHDDADHTYTRAVERAFFKKDGIDRIETCQVLRLGAGRDAEITAVTTARKLLDQRHADLLIGGEMLKKEEAVSLWFIGKDPAHDWQPSTFRLDANLLKKDFSDAASTQLLSVALSAIRPATEESGRYLVGILKPVSVRLRHLLEAATGFSATQTGALEYALGLALFAIGEQAGDNSALADAAKAFRAALAERPRHRVPLQWAATQANLANALGKLGERESGTAHLEEAVAAYHAALEEGTRGRVPLQWAGTQNNLSAVLGKLGEREGGTARLEEAIAANRAALEEWTRNRVPLQWAMAQDNLGFALRTLGEREEGTARLEEAVAAYHSALEERTRDRVPLDWAASAGNQGIALMLLAERLSDATRAQTATQQIEVASEIMRNDGNASDAAFFEAALSKARILFNRLTSH